MCSITLKQDALRDRRSYVGLSLQLLFYKIGQSTNQMVISDGQKIIFNMYM